MQQGELIHNSLALEFAMQTTYIEDSAGNSSNRRLKNLEFGIDIEELLDDGFALDLDKEGLLKLHLISTQIGMKDAETMHDVIARRGEGILGWEDVVTIVAEESAVQVSDLGSDYENIGGVQFTYQRIRERNTSLLAAYGTSVALTDLVGSEGTKPTTLRLLMSRAKFVNSTLLQAGLGQDIDAKKEENLSIAMRMLRKADLDSLSEADHQRFNTFRQLLLPVSRSTIYGIDRNRRRHDITLDPQATMELVFDNIANFVKDFSDDEIAELTDKPELVDTAIEVISREISQATECTFATTADHTVEVMNKGRKQSTEIIAAIEDKRADPNTKISTRTHMSKAEVFAHYTPELRKLGIILGGNFYDTQEVYKAAAGMLDDIYNNAEDDIVVFPSPNDLIIELAMQMNAGAFSSLDIELDTIDEKQKQAVLERLEEYYELQSSQQQADSANCFGTDTNIFFVNPGQSQKPAHNVCADCPQERRETCLIDNVRNLHGFWADTTERGRVKIRRDLRILDAEVTDNEAVVEAEASEGSKKDARDLSDVEYDPNAADMDEDIDPYAVDDSDWVEGADEDVAYV